LYELNDLTDLDLESDEVTTVGGYVTHALGHFPKMGEKMRISHYEVTTTKVEARRVGQLHFKRIERPTDEPESAAASSKEAEAV
jgi:Mg2+/Co2+ transporter CorC